MKILILCTGNSCRSQMAEGFLRSLDEGLEIHSAGTEPAEVINPLAVMVMKESGIDLNLHYPKNVDEFLNVDFDYVITVCGDAQENCPVFSGKVKQRLHIGFEDPAKAEGSEEEIVAVFRKVREQIREKFKEFYDQTLIQ